MDGKAPADEYPTKDRVYEKLTVFVEEQAEAYNNDPDKSGIIATPGGDDDSLISNPQGISIHLDGNQLEAAKQSGLPWFIKYYAPWCGHCQRLAPSWEQMAKELKRQVNVGEVNCDDHRGKRWEFLYMVI